MTRNNRKIKDDIDRQADDVLALLVWIVGVVMYAFNY